MRGRSLTELEGTVLGVVQARRPCTPYQVRREFLDSPSPYWSGSAGAIYPLMERLERAGLLAGAVHVTGARRGRRYRLTAAGRRALRRWVAPPLADTVVGVPPDPLRTRIAFLDVLPPADRRAFLRDAAQRMRQHLAAAERGLATGEPGGPYFELMAEGAVAMLRARLAWLARARRTLERAGGTRRRGV